jgi:hypothetical protein
MYHEIRPQKSHSWWHHEVRFSRLCGQMPSSTMEYYNWGPQWIRPGAHYVPQLYTILLLDRLQCRYGATPIRLHAGSYYCCVRFYVLVLIAGLGPYFRCLHCCCAPATGVLDEASVVPLDSDLITPGWGVCGAITCCCGKGEEDDNRKRKVLRNI